MYLFVLTPVYAYYIFYSFPEARIWLWPISKHWRCSLSYHFSVVQAHGVLSASDKWACSWNLILHYKTTPLALPSLLGFFPLCCTLTGGVSKAVKFIIADWEKGTTCRRIFSYRTLHLVESSAKLGNLCTETKASPSQACVSQTFVRDVMRKVKRESLNISLDVNGSLRRDWCTDFTHCKADPHVVFLFSSWFSASVFFIFHSVTHLWH